MARTYLVSLRLEVDERGDNPINWDWATLLDMPFTGGVEVLYSGELKALDEMTSPNVESK